MIKAIDVSNAEGHRDFQRLLIRPEATLFEAMEMIERESIELVFVADDRGRVLGTLSDGDVRRAILRGAALHAPGVRAAMNPNFRWVSTEVGRAEALDLMKSLEIGVVPVLDESGVIVGLHLLYDLIGAHEKPNVAVLMAGGRGTRLLPLTSDTPKPMLLVAGRPILERLVLQLVGSGIRTIYISINYLGHVIENHFKDGAKFGCEIHYVREDKPLGTGGALSLLPKTCRRNPMIVMNGDIITEVDVSRLLRFHEDGGFAMTACLRPWQTEIPFGVAEVEGDALIGIREKPKQQHLVNTGVYAVSDKAVQLIPEATEFTMPDLIERCFSRQFKVGAFQMQGDWIDVGRPDTLKQARGMV